MFGNSRRLFSIRGVDISVDLSWLVIAALVTWSLWSRLQTLYGHGTAVALPLAVLGAVLFFASVLAHELAHALEGRHRGAEIRGITLFLFGGVTRSKMDVESPKDEFAFAAVGPYASFVIAGGIGLAVLGLNEWAPGWSPLADILGIIGWINIGLGVFNLLPGAPLDGGRVLRSAIWKVTGDRPRSIRLAGRAGQVLGLSLIGLGLLQLFGAPAGSFGGLWLAFIGWFLFAAAKQEIAMGKLKEELADEPVRSLVSRPPATLSADVPLSDVVDILRRTDPDVLPVESAGAVVGTLSVEQVADVSSAHRSQTPVQAVMTPREQLEEVEVDDPASTVLDSAASGEAVLVTDQGDVVGLLTPQRLATVMQRSQSFRRRSFSRGRRTGSGTGSDETWIPRSDS